MPLYYRKSRVLVKLDIGSSFVNNTSVPSNVSNVSGSKFVEDKLARKGNIKSSLRMLLGPCRTMHCTILQNYTRLWTVSWNYQTSSPTCHFVVAMHYLNLSCWETDLTTGWARLDFTTSKQADRRPGNDRSRTFPAFSLVPGGSLAIKRTTWPNADWVNPTVGPLPSSDYYRKTMQQKRRQKLFSIYDWTEGREEEWTHSGSIWCEKQSGECCWPYSLRVARITACLG